MYIESKSDVVVLVCYDERSRLRNSIFYIAAGLQYELCARIATDRQTRVSLFALVYMLYERNNLSATFCS